MDKEKRTDIYMYNLINKFSHQSYKLRARELAFSHITPTQATMLILLHDLGPDATLFEISKRAGRATGAISVLLSLMEKKGLIKKFRDPSGTIRKRFELTNDGEINYNIAIKHVLVSKIFSALSDEEQKTFIKYMNKLINQISSLEKEMETPGDISAATAQETV